MPLHSNEIRQDLERASVQAPDTPHHELARPGRRVIELHADADAHAALWCEALANEGLHSRLSRLSLPVSHGSGAARPVEARVLLLATSLTERLALLRQWRTADAALPLLVVARDLRDLDQVLALEMGADDVMDANASPSVLCARLRNVWRRTHPDPLAAPQTDELRFGALCLQVRERSVHLGSHGVDLTEAEFELLWLLASRAGHTVTRSELLRHTRGLEYEPHDRSIDSRVHRVRLKLGDLRGSTQRIRTVRNCGYVFVPSGW